jgi:serine/threonine protein kinase
MDNLIGEGMSGKVYYPALNIPGAPIGNYVSKLTSSTVAKAEMEFASIIKQSIPDGAIYAEYMVKLDEDDPHRITTKFGIIYDTCVFSIYGGVSLVEYYSIIEHAAYKDSVTETAIFDDIIQALLELQTEVETMNKKGFYHNDISHDNVVYNKDEKKARLVDFERAGYNGANDVEDVSALIDDFKTLLAKYNKKHEAEARNTKRKRKHKSLKINRNYKCRIIKSNNN